MGIGTQAVELPQSIQDNEEVIYDNIEDDRFEVTLSVSTKEVRSKAEGGMGTEFEIRTIDATDNSALATVLTNYN